MVNRLFSHSRVAYTFSFIAVCLLCYFAFFWKLDAMPVMLFDEGRQLVTACEMGENHNYLITYYDHKPDLWNCKPPILIWLILASFKLFGIGVESGRLPAALSGVILCLFIYCLLSFKYKKPWLGLLAVCILATSPGYVGIHVTRTADYDGVLILFVVLYAYHFYQFLITEKPFHMAYVSLFFVLAFLTKGIGSLLITPGILLFVLIQKRLLFIIKNKWFYIWGLLGVSIIASYYLYHEYATPGFLQAVAENELGGRFNKPLEGNKGEWYFYFEKFWTENRFFIGSIIYVPLTIIAVWYNGPLKKFANYAALIALSYLVVMSVSQTKLRHYDAQAYPFMAITIAIGMYNCIEIVKAKKIALQFIVGSLIVFCCSAMLHRGFCELNWLTTTYYGNELNYGKVFNQLEREYPKVKHVVTYAYEYNAPRLFYEKMYRSRGMDVDSRWIYDHNFEDPNLYQPGDTLLLCNSEQIDYVFQHIKNHPLTQNGGCYVIVVDGEK